MLLLPPPPIRGSSCVRKLLRGSDVLPSSSPSTTHTQCNNSLNLLSRHHRTTSNTRHRLSHPPPLEITERSARGLGRVASLRESVESCSSCSAQKARTDSGSVREWCRSAHPTALREKKSFSIITACPAAHFPVNALVPGTPSAGAPHAADPDRSLAYPAHIRLYGRQARIVALVCGWAWGSRVWGIPCSYVGGGVGR
eukprot:3056376-Rhodomonas_salina.1